MLGRLKKDKSGIMEVTIANRTVFRILVMVIFSLLFLAALQRAAGALVLVFVAFFLAVSLNYPVQWIASHLPGKQRGSRTLATSVSFLAVVLVLGAFLAMIIPPLVRETRTFIGAVPALVQDVRDKDSTLGSLINRYNLQDDIDNVSSELSKRLNVISGKAVSTVTTIGGTIISTLTVLVMTYMMLIEGPIWLRRFRSLIPKHRHEQSDRIVGDMYKVVKGYVNGQVLLATIAAIVVLPPLFALHVSYPIALMVIVFICGLIPLVGHTIGAAIVSAVALFTSPWAAVIVLTYYILYQQIENYFIQPHVQANATNMSPLLVFVSVIIGVSFGGLLGGLIAIPFVGCLRILVLEYLHTKRPFDEESDASMAYKT